MTSRLAQLSKSRTLLATLVLAVIAAVAATAVGYASLNKEVSLSVDGESRTVKTMGSTVADVLEDEGIEVGEHDEVLPSLDEEVADGSRIAVRFGRELELTVDGRTSKHWVHSTDVASALAEIDRRFQGADLSASRSAVIGRDGLALEVATPKKLRIAYGDKKTVTEKVAGLTVADVLEKLELEVDGNDIVEPKLRATVSDGDRIEVTKVRIVTKRVKGEAIAHGTVKREDSSMFEGETEVVTPGRDGARDVTYRIVFHNGQEHRRTVEEQKVTRKATDEVVKVGTKSRPAPAANFAPGNSVWDRLAQCESGGNWAANTGNGYYGGLQFSASTWRSVGGTGLPHQHSRAEQIKRAQILQARAGWGQWPHCTAKLGLR